MSSNLNSYVKYWRATRKNQVFILKDLYFGVDSEVNTNLTKETKIKTRLVIKDA